MKILPSLASLFSAATLGLADQWDNLNTTVNGRLFRGSPLGLPCFLNSSSADCLAVTENYTDELFRANTPGAYIVTQWETCQSTNEGCLLDPSHPDYLSQCSLGSVFPYFIDIRAPSDVAAAFEFSKKYGVPIVIKNTGHDYRGRSSQRNSLGLWTHNLKDISYNPSFAACAGDAGQPAMTLGAGVQWHEAYEFADAHNLTIIGGNDPGVGASGGWIQGGGHGLLSNTFGLGVDRVLEFQLVTPDGVLRTVNKCQNQDLFFALRGGGGGTFGVVLSSTFLVVPNAIPISVGYIAWTTPANASLTEELWTIMANNSLRWTSEGWGAAARSQATLYVNPKLTKDQAQASLKPLLDFGQSVPDAQIIFTQFPSYYSFFQAFLQGGTRIGASLALTSRLINKSNFETAQSRSELVEALLALYAQAGDSVLILMDTPASFPYSSGATSVTEAWRESIFHVTSYKSWGWNATTEEKKLAYSKASKAIGELRKITKDAAYLNEADVYEPNHETAFWGTNYARLLEIKNKYDPDRVLDCWQCVGWNPNSSRFKCYL